MNWFDTSGLTNLAKNALKEAQKTIDKALDIEDESSEEQEEKPTKQENSKSSPGPRSAQNNADFFASWGLTVSAESEQDATTDELPVVTESPSKAPTTSLWGSFAGSFFEHQKTPESDTAIVRPPKAKSMNVIADTNYDESFSKNLLIVDSDADTKKDAKTDGRRSSSRSAGLSLMSSRNSSDSVEVLSQSMKTTPDSEASAHSMSHSSSVDKKLNSEESVEILPDSLVSPSSIECLGFDSYSSDKNSSPSSNLTPEEESDKKSTPVGDITAKAELTADSVSLVADDDEDTMSYNSISECTAPTVLDTDEKSSPFPKRSESLRKIPESLQLEQCAVPQRMLISENSSNDGSWSDRTLNADSDSVILDATFEEQKKEASEDENTLIDKLSDSSSFYNVHTSELPPEGSGFVKVETQNCDPSTESSAKSSVKERTSPISSDSKSDLVKVGSGSGHTSGDELETTTSSDIEIIPSPNGDNGHHGYCRSSPGKYVFKQAKFYGTMSPNLVDLVLGKSLATKIRGHNRELSEASIQSNTSDESQGSENDRLMRRLCEMAEILEARESKLMEVSRSNAELAENNADLKTQVETLMTKHEGGDISTLTEEYTQRMSALEKKFQQAIREKDQLRKQLDSAKTESSRKLSSELENSLKEKDDMIAQLQEEGEKLSRQQLQHSNIIKKLRAKEKENEQVIKGLRDKIADQTAEMDRMKRSIAAKEELEVSQIEAVHRLTVANKKMETELAETKSSLDDTTQRLDSTSTSLEAVKKELSDLQRASNDATRLAAELARCESERARAEASEERLRAALQRCAADLEREQQRWSAREASLRAELHTAREMASASSGGAPGVAGAAPSGGAASLLAQLASLQRSALDRERSHGVAMANAGRQIEEAEASLAKAKEQERIAREENLELSVQLTTAQQMLDDVQSRLQEATEQCQKYLERVQLLEETVKSKTRELEKVQEELTSQLTEATNRLAEKEKQLEMERSNYETEKKRNSILQEQLSSRGDISPPQSVASDTLSASLWATDDFPPDHPISTWADIESLTAQRTRRDGELRSMAADAASARRQVNAMAARLAEVEARVLDYQNLQEQYDALLQMYGEKEEQLAELRLDLADVTQLYKAQLDELIALRQRR